VLKEGFPPQATGVRRQACRRHTRRGFPTEATGVSLSETLSPSDTLRERERMIACALRIPEGSLVIVHEQRTNNKLQRTKRGRESERKPGSVLFCRNVAYYVSTFRGQLSIWDACYQTPQAALVTELVKDQP
jgi:hypothetical protein